MQNNQQPESVFDFTMNDFDAVPQGQYIALFRDVQKTSHEQWGEGVMFVFEIAAGEFKGQTATRIGKPKPSTQNATGKIISGLTGQTFKQDDKIDLRSYVGKPYQILVEPTQGGKTRIAQVWPYQRQQQTMPVATMPVAPTPTPSPANSNFSQTNDFIGIDDITFS